MAGFEVALAKMQGYSEDASVVLVHPPVNETLAESLKTGILRGYGLLVSNGESDCTEISFLDEERLAPGELRQRVASILEREGHQVSIIDPVVKVSVLDPKPESLHDRFVRAA